MSEATAKQQRRWYRVTISEKVTESRVYSIVANDGFTAAKRAKKLWVDHGVNPNNGHILAVEYRDYIVEELEGEGDTEWFTIDEVEVVDDEKGGSKCDY